MPLDKGVIFLFTLLWLVTAISAYFVYAYFLQLKEYRLDRLKDFSLSPEGQRMMWSYHFLPRTIFAFSLLTLLHTFLDIQIIFFIILAVDFLVTALLFVQRKLRRPAPTLKAATLIVCALVIEAALILSMSDMFVVLFFLVMRGTVIVFVMFLLSVPTGLFKKILVFQAKKKMQLFPQLIRIGITGSYAKTSTKEFTAHLLSQKYRVLKTPKNINTEVGIARFILRTDLSRVDIFVCEMGAYKRGEIQIICDMVQPSIGVLTAIAEQHLALFGSIQNIQQAKYELLRSIPEDGFVVTNADNLHCMELLSELQCKHIETFGVDPERQPTCLTTNIKTTLEGTTFEGTYRGLSGEVHTPVLGAHHATNIAAAVMVAFHLHVSGELIKKGCESLPRDIHGSLQIFLYGTSTIIDDSYNSNAAGFRSALDVLSLFPSQKKRILITRGMIELGGKSREIHERIGEEISLVVDELVVITKDSFDALKRGVGTKYQTKIYLKDTVQDLLEYIHELKKRDAIVLIENRLPTHVYAALQKEKAPYDETSVS